MTLSMCAATGVTDDEENREVELLNVKGNVLEKVIEYCTHHVDSPPKEIQKV